MSSPVRRSPRIRFELAPALLVLSAFCLPGRPGLALPAAEATEFEVHYTWSHHIWGEDFDGPLSAEHESTSGGVYVSTPQSWADELTLFGSDFRSSTSGTTSATRIQVLLDQYGYGRGNGYALGRGEVSVFLRTLAPLTYRLTGTVSAEDGGGMLELLDVLDLHGNALHSFRDPMAQFEIGYLHFDETGVLEPGLYVLVASAGMAADGTSALFSSGAVSFDFRSVAAPEPSALGLLALAGFAALGARPRH